MGRDWGWFVIIQKTRPLIGQPNPAEELRLLEEKCNETYGAYEEALNVTKQMEEDNIKVKEDTAAMNKELSSKSGDMAVYQQRQAAALERKAKAEESLENKNQELAREESGRIDLQNEKKKMENGVGDRKKGVDDVRMKLQTKMKSSIDLTRKRKWLQNTLPNLQRIYLV